MGFASSLSSSRSSWPCSWSRGLFPQTVSVAVCAPAGGIRPMAAAGRHPWSCGTPTPVKSSQVGPSPSPSWVVRLPALLGFAAAAAPSCSFARDAGPASVTGPAGALAGASAPSPRTSKCSSVTVTMMCPGAAVVPPGWVGGAVGPVWPPPGFEVVARPAAPLAVGAGPPWVKRNLRRGPAGPVAGPALGEGGTCVVVLTQAAAAAGSVGGRHYVSAAEAPVAPVHGVGPLVGLVGRSFVSLPAPSGVST